MDYTPLFSAILTLITALITTFLIPVLKERLESEKIARWVSIVDIAVRAAEQIYQQEDGATKKAYVFNYLAEKGIRLDPTTVDNLIEASVLKMKTELLK